MVEKENGFPDTYKYIPTKKLLEIFSVGPDRLKKVLENITLPEMRKRVIPDKWSIAEILIHVVDSEIMGYCRIMQTITQSDNKFAHYNQNVWADILNYNSYPKDIINTRFILLESMRKSLFYVFNNIPEKKWNEKGNHYEMGYISLRNLLELYTDHCERHIEQIIERRKILEKPIELKPILKIRLY